MYVFLQRQENERFLRELQESVECPVCFSVPRAPPVPCCQNGHVICTRYDFFVYEAIVLLQRKDYYFVFMSNHLQDLKEN